MASLADSARVEKVYPMADLQRGARQLVSDRMTVFDWRKALAGYSPEEIAAYCRDQFGGSYGDMIDVMCPDDPRLPHSIEWRKPGGEVVAVAGIVIYPQDDLETLPADLRPERGTHFRRLFQAPTHSWAGVWRAPWGG